MKDEILKKLMAAAKDARKRAYAPYSSFKVGAALLFEDGEIISGCNVENSSYGLTVCAERNAMAAAVSSGKGAPIAAAVAGEPGTKCTPCGACRQFLAEFNPNMDIIMEDGDNLIVRNLSALLPEHFSPKNLNIKQG